MSVLKKIKEFSGYILEDGYNPDYQSCGGWGEDNNMTVYRYDIIFTRMKFRVIALNKGMKPRFRFKKRDFRWEKHHDMFFLMGKLVLVDSEGVELVSDDMEWMRLISPKDWKKYLGNWYISNGRYTTWLNKKNENERRWDYINELYRQLHLQQETTRI